MWVLNEAGSWWPLIKLIYATIFYTDFSKKKFFECVWRWLQKFEVWDFDLSNTRRFGGNPFLLTANSQQRGSRKSWIQLNISDHILKLELVWKYSSENNLNDRNTTYTPLLAPFLDRIITGKATWITNEKIVRRRAYCHLGKPATSISKSNLSLNNRIFCICSPDATPSNYHLFLSLQIPKDRPKQPDTSISSLWRSKMV